MSSVSDRHYSVQQIAEMWNVSANTIRTLFEEEPGVLKLVSPRAQLMKNKTRKPYTTLLISETARNRVYERLAGGFLNKIQSTSRRGKY